MLNNLFVFLDNACGNDCITDGGHLCENCYNITKFCDECSIHLENVLDISDFKYWALFCIIGILCLGLGYLFGSFDRY